MKDPLRLNPASSATPACTGSARVTDVSDEEGHGCGCSAPALPGSTEKPLPAFWREAARRRVFRAQLIENALFLGKWLLLAFLLEQLVTRYVPEAWIASTLGGEGLRPILLATLIGGPAYINGYAAVPLVNSLIEQGIRRRCHHRRRSGRARLAGHRLRPFFSLPLPPTWSIGSGNTTRRGGQTCIGCGASSPIIPCC